MSNKLKWPHSLFSLSIFSSLPSAFLSLLLSLSPSLHTSPSLSLSLSLTSLANCEAVVQHARQTASQHAGLSPIMHNHNRQKGYMQTTDRIALKSRGEENGRQGRQWLWQRVGERARKDRGAVRERERERERERRDRGNSLALRGS